MSSQSNGEAKPATEGLLPVAESASYAPAFLFREGNERLGELAEKGGARLDAALLFADISGFTPLANRLAEQGAAGAERLSLILNEYFGELLAIVDTHGGEAIKFAGDALFALWPASTEEIRVATRRAASCALAMRQALDSRDVGDATLSLRIAISAGEATLIEVRADEERHLVLAGPAMRDVIGASEVAVSGQIVASADAWAHLTPNAEGQTTNGSAMIVQAIVAPPEPLPPKRVHFESASERVEAYVPDPLRARIAAGHGQWLAELRRISVIFTRIDGVDHTALDAQRQLQLVTDRVRRVATQFDGLLKEVLVDDKGIVVITIFGVPPRAHEDDASRALRAAMAVRDALAADDLHASCGVATGRCFCGVVGTHIRREFAVVGDVMNLAARLMGAVADLPDAAGVLCDLATSQQAVRIVTEALPPMMLKGRSSAVPVYRPRGERTERVRSAETIVGRHREREAIDAALRRTAGSLAPGALLIVGEAGAGKTRLVDEVVTTAAATGVRTLIGHADAIEVSTPYHVWRQVIADILQVDLYDDAATRRRAIERRLGDALAPLAPLLEAVVPLGFEETAVTSELTGTARASATRAVLLALLDDAAKTPTAIVLEDGHWFDSASWALALDAVQRIERLLVVITTRPHASGEASTMGAIAEDSRSTVLTLGPLMPEEALQLVAQRLGVATLSPEVAEVISARAGGQPFFATELAYALRDGGSLDIRDGTAYLRNDAETSVLTLPDTVQGVVTARIDRLPTQEQLTLKVASVLGTSFPARILREVHPVQSDVARLSEQLEALVQANLTMLERPAPDVAYAFRHAITRDVAYELMLFSQRRQLHHAVAEWYETAHPGDRSELLALLAHHWRAAGEASRAVDYLEQSATRTFSMGLGRASVDQGLEAARLLGVELPTDSIAIVPMLGAELGTIQQLLGGRTPEMLLEHRSLADADTGRIIGLLLRVMPFAHQSLQAELFALMALRCMSLTVERGNGPAAPVVYAMFSIVYRAMTGDSLTAYKFSRLALELDRRSGSYLLGPVSFISTWFNQHWHEPVANGIVPSREAAERAFAIGDVLYGCFNLAACVVYVATSGHSLDQVIETGREHYARVGRRVLNAGFHCVHEMQLAKALAGRTIDRLSLTDDEYDEARDVAFILSTDHYNQIGVFLISKLRVHYYYRDYRTALEYAEKATALLPAFAGQIGESDLVFFHALTLLGHPAIDESMMANAHVKAATLERWTVGCEANFRHKLEIVQGELARVDGRLMDARMSFDAAARSASIAGYVQYEALAYELGAGVAMSESARAERFAAAADAYRRWGAYAKVADVEQRATTTDGPSAVSS